MDRSFLFNDSALRILCVGFGTLRYHIDTLYDSTLLVNEHFQHTAGLTFTSTRVYVNDITLFDM